MRAIGLVLSLGVILATAPAAPAAPRTWTSTGGQKVQAELVDQADGLVTLQLATGKRVQIAEGELIPADRAFLKAQKPAAAKPAAAGAQPAKIDAALLIGPKAHEKPADFAPASIPGLKVRTTNETINLGLQLGPGQNDVLYIVLDPPRSEQLPDAAYAYSPGLAGFATPVKFRGLRKRDKTLALATTTVRTKPGAKSVGKSAGKANETVNFGPLRVLTHYGPVAAEWNLVISMGGGGTWDLPSVRADVQLSHGTEKCAFELIGLVGDVSSVGVGAFKSKPLFAKPALKLDVESGKKQCDYRVALDMGTLLVIPRSGGRSWIVVTDTAAAAPEGQEAAAAPATKGKVLDRVEAQFDETALSKDTMTGKSAFLTRGKRFKGNRQHVATVTVDLGFLFGPLTAKTEFVPLDKEK